MIAQASARAARRDAEAYQARILPAVSRTFALTIPQLDPRLRTVIANAYLLCRIADTIEDERALPGDVKQQFHDRFTRVVGSAEDPASFARDLAPLLNGNTLAAERDLVAHTPDIIEVTDGFNLAQRESLARCIRTMCTGMPRFERDASTAGLADMREMDSYCYYVAGIVGQTLTDLFCDYSPQIAERRAEMAALDVSFGQGLQMTNILKDFWEDRDRGVCWLPHDLFARAGVNLEDLRRSNVPAAFGKTYAQLIGIAHSHLRNALDYTLLIPEKEAGIRRFCLIALGLAMRTLASILAHPGFTTGAQVKVSRQVVKKVVIVTRLFAGYSRVLQRWFARMAAGLPVQALASDWGGLLPDPRATWPRNDTCGPAHAATSK
ncbi:MAG: squalene/phytoene synthase family protein [Rhodanobacteraceae bacterium]|nr:MAG: squalene/phytoene synthase family protein [Rhodanobacteraceae bacterium]